MGLTAANLVGYLRAAYAKSAKLRIWQFVIQLLIAVPAAISVVVTDNTGSYILGIIGAALLVAWVVVNTIYLSERSAAHTARRAALLAGGLTQPFSAATVLRAWDKTAAEGVGRGWTLSYPTISGRWSSRFCRLSPRNRKAVALVSLTGRRWPASFWFCGRACSGSTCRVQRWAAAARRVGGGWAHGRRPASGPRCTG